MVQKLLSGSTNTAAGTSYEPKRQQWNTSNTGVWGCVITGTATVVLEGSFDLVTWFTIDTMSTNGIKAVNLLPHMRARPSANTGSVDAYLYE